MNQQPTRMFLGFAGLWLVLSLAVSADDLAEFFQNDPYRNYPNIALHEAGGSARIVQAGKPDIPADFLIDGSPAVDKCSLFEGLPFSVIIRFATPKDLEAIRLFSGNPEYAVNASGDCAIRSCTVKVQQAGQWHDAQLATQALPSFAEMKAQGVFTHHVTSACKKKAVSAVQVEVYASTDTGKRMSSDKLVPPAARVCYLREIEVFSSEKTVVPRPIPIMAFLGGDFRLPVYVGEAEAELVLESKELMTEAFGVQVELFEQTGQQRIARIAPIACRPASQTTVRVPLGKLPTGLYRAEICRPDKRGDFLTRWLRIQRPVTTPQPQAPLAIQGRKMLFLDDHYLQSRQKFIFEKQTAETLPILAKNVETGYVVNQGLAFFCGVDGRFYYQFQIMPIEGMSIIGYVKSSAEKKYCTAVSEDLKSWTILDGLKGAPAPKKALYSPQAVNQSIDWSKVQQCRFYDPAKDGKIALDKVKMVYTGDEAPHWGDLKIRNFCVYPVLEKSPTEVLVLQSEPLLQNRAVSAEDESPGEWGDQNDNWGGQWLSDDGTTLYYIVARLVPRKSPFIVRYDNYVNVQRLLVLWKSQDGLHWTQSFIVPPQPTDPLGWQQYGITHAPYRGAGVRIGFLSPYDCLRQQIYIDLVYSYDNENWLRPDPLKKFAVNGPMGSWGFGEISCAPDHTVEKDGFCYTALLSCYSLPHFSFLWVFSREEANAGLLEKLLANKEIERWPYWQQLGSFKKMYETLKVDSNTPYRSFGLMKYRRDGFVAMRAAGDLSTATTCRLRGAGQVLVNARCAADGFLSLAVLDGEGRPLPEYSGENAARIDGDRIDAPVRWKGGSLATTPEGVDYRLLIEGKQAELFSLSFH